MEYSKIIAELDFCAAQCRHCYQGCIEEKDKDMLSHCMSLDEDCGDICRLASVILERESENAERFLKLVAEICELCATECEKHDLDHCQKCAQACRKCAEMCLSPQLAE